MTLTLNRKIYLGLTGAMLAMALLVFTCMRSAQRQHEELEDIVDRHAISLVAACQVQHSLATLDDLAARTCLAAITGGGASSLSSQVDAEIAELNRLFEQIATLDDEGLARTQLAGLRSGLADWQRQAPALFQRVAAGDASGATLLLHGLDTMSVATDREAASLQSAIGTHLSEMRALEQSSYGRSLALQIALLGISVAVLLAFAIWIRGITRDLSSTATSLHAGAEQVMAAAAQVATSSQSLSEGATQQAASLEETSASMVEMADMTRQNAEHSAAAATLMAELESQVSVSNEALRDMVNSMDGISESSGKVAKIIKTIDEIAFQTNILALNAAVEAARAGEAGMGFAVVADEVRNLAQRSAQAAKDTASLIDESSRNADAGGAKVEQVAVAITAITDSLARVKGLVDEVSEASRQQAQGIQQVTESVGQMERITQSTAATAEESAAASQQLSAQAETTRHLVSGLDALISGVTAQARAGWQSAAAPARRQSVRPARPVRASASGAGAESVIPFAEHACFVAEADAAERSQR